MKETYLKCKKPTYPVSSQEEMISKRELFFRQDGSYAANGTSTSGSKENNDKDFMTNRKENMENLVGFANLPNQIYRKAIKKGFEFSVMVVGESGLGKSTLLNSMFLADIYAPEYPGPSHRIKKTIQVEHSQVVIKENGVGLSLTVVDTPGFGDAVDNSKCWQPITDYIETRFEEYLISETRVNRTALPDRRVHVCLYFLAPSGHSLKPLDIEVMKQLHDKVNIIPIIAKADTLTPEECSTFKRNIMRDIALNQIKIYSFPQEEEEETKAMKVLKERVPFAVVGSNTMVEVNGKMVRGRRYPWGVAEVENLEHCDFLALRNILIKTHLQDLKDITSTVHYENYRFRKMAPASGPGDKNTKNPLARMEDEKKEHELKMKRMEQEMEQVFEMKVKEKLQKLKDSELELQRRNEQMRKSLDLQRSDLEENRRLFEKDKMAFEIANKDMEDVLRRMSLETKENADSKEKKKEKKKGLF